MKEDVPLRRTPNYLVSRQNMINMLAEFVAGRDLFFVPSVARGRAAWHDASPFNLPLYLVAVGQRRALYMSMYMWAVAQE